MRGASLIELLVALVIASLGLLTTVALQAASVRYTQVSQRRAVVTLLAGDLSERIRANTVESADLALYQFSETFSTQRAQNPVVPPVVCDQAAVTCSLSQMAAFDLFKWRQRVRDLLPEGAVIIQLVSNNTQLGIWVAWRDPVMHQAAGNEPRAAGECPPNLDLDAVADATVRCLSWRISR